MLYKRVILGKDEAIAELISLYKFSCEACEKLYEFYNGDSSFVKDEDINNSKDLKSRWVEYASAKEALCDLYFNSVDDIMLINQMSVEEAEEFLRLAFAKLYPNILLHKLKNKNGYLIKYRNNEIN